MKKIIVDCCGECPWFEHGTPTNRDHCNNPKTPGLWIYDTKTISLFCELEDE